MKILGNTGRTQLLTFALLASSSPAFATSFFVDGNVGNNANDCLSWESACKTISAAVGKSAANDVISVNRGIYNERVYIPRGKDGLRIIGSFRGRPIIDGNVAGGAYLPSTSWSSLVSIDANYVTFKNFEIRNSNVRGIHTYGYGIQAAGHHNLLENLLVHDIWATGIYSEGDYNVIRSNTVYRTCMHNSRSSSSPNYRNALSSENGWGQGITVANNNRPEALIPGITSYNIVENNRVYDNWSEGIGTFHSANITLRNNMTYDNYTVNLYVSDTSNTLVERNLVFRTNEGIIKDPILAGSGLSMADERGDKPRSRNNIVRNNTILNTEVCLQCWSIPADAGLKNLTFIGNTIVDSPVRINRGGGVNTPSAIRNNIFWGFGNSYTIDGANIAFSNNVWRSRPAGANGSGDVLLDPGILRTIVTPGRWYLTRDYFKIPATSPAVNAGTALPVLTDDMLAAPRGARPDIGAYEATQ